MALSTGLQFNVKKFGAKGDGIILDTPSIQRAIDKAYESGGGEVIVPPGVYKIGTLIIKDNVNLHLPAGSELLGSADIKDYTEIAQKLESRTNRLYAKYFVIFAQDAKNISITGSGIINGNGFGNFQITRPQNERPFLIRFVNCENVTIRDVQLLESANWTLHLLACKNVTIDGIKIINRTRENRDGIDIDACKNVTVSNCRISSGDDAIALKSTNNNVCENIAITNCVLSSGASAIKSGTESNGGFRNITVSNCVIKDVPEHAGIEFMAVDGGDLENITFSNIVMENVATPMFIYLGNRARPFKNGQYVTKVSNVHDIYFDNITIINAKLPSGVVGLNYKAVKSVSFDNISIRYSEALKGKPLNVNNVPLKDFSYPMARMFGVNLPAYGFYCRNVEGLSFKNVSVYSARGEQRPAFVFDKVNNFELYSVKSFNYDFSSAMAYLRNSQDGFFSLCRTLNRTEFLFKIEKKNCENIHLFNNLLHKGQKEVNEVKALKDTEIFAKIKSKSKYSVERGKKIDGLIAQNISEKPLIVTFEVTKKLTPQICLLIKNNTLKPEKVRIEYGSIRQEFLIDWNKWGWAPITLIKKFNNSQKVSFRIEAVDKNCKLVVSKVYLRNLQLDYTD